MLAAGTAGTVCIDTQIVGIDLYTRIAPDGMAGHINLEHDGVYKGVPYINLQADVYRPVEDALNHARYMGYTLPEFYMFRNILWTPESQIAFQKTLKEMVKDGVAIIKVGPALTFYLREALFALSFMEEEIVKDPDRRSHFREVLDKEMMDNPKYWINYYSGTDDEKALKRKYSFSDRSRYYMSLANVENARRKLFENIDNADIPISMLKQYMPKQYNRVRDGLLSMKAKDLVKDNVVQLVEDYNYAVRNNYMIGVL